MATSETRKQRINLSIDPEVYAGMRRLLIEKHGIPISRFTEFLYSLMLQLEEMGFDVIDQRARERLSKRGVNDPNDHQLVSETMQMLSGFMTVWVKAYAKGAELNRGGAKGEKQNRAGLGAGPKPKHQHGQDEADQQNDEQEPNTTEAK